VAIGSSKNSDKAILTLAHYDEIGGLEKALSQHAKKAYAELDSKQQEIAEILFRNLTAPNNTRRPIKLEKIAILASVFSFPNFRYDHAFLSLSVEQSINYVDLPEHWRYSSARDYVGQIDNRLSCLVNIRRVAKGKA
jgi:hypothetical protein